MRRYPPVAVKVWGPMACFTRPEAKVERVSYPVMTPSAARGILDSIFWKPEIEWRIRAVHVLKPIYYFSMMRNEITDKVSPKTVLGWAKDGIGGYFADEHRAQRYVRGLRDVAYAIYADPVLKPHTVHNIAKYRHQFRRRVARGQCHQMPYLGCREYIAYFGPVEEQDVPLPFDLEIGPMLFDMKFELDASGELTGVAEPIFFEARIQNGILHIPDELYERRGG